MGVGTINTGSARGGPGSEQRRLLLVDDDPLLSSSVSRYLRAHGWTVDAAFDGATGCQSVRSNKYSLVIVDLRMPNMGGSEVLQAAREASSAPDVIVMSAFLDLKNTLAALALGAIDVLEKPVDPARLVAILEQAVLRRMARLSPSHLSGDSDVEEILGQSRKIHALRTTIRSIAPFDDVPALIVGETGTGKELVARSVHRQSGRPGEMLSINCASIPEELFESELFGHEAGAFTGARGARQGLLEAACDGTVFLDEVGEMPPSQQAKLLRVLEVRTFRRIGSSREIPMRARIVSATNRPLRSSAAGECIRSDLFFRLAGCTLRTPPLRDRKEDIEELALHFLACFARSNPSCPTTLSASVLPALHSCDWPGNVRELRAVIHNAAIRTSHSSLGIREVAEAMAEQGCVQAAMEPSLEAPSLTAFSFAPGVAAPANVALSGDATVHGSFAQCATPSTFPTGSQVGVPIVVDEARASASNSSVGFGDGASDGLEASEPLRSVELSMIRRAFRDSGGNISRAARTLGIPRTTLRDKLRRLGIR